jgi:hypothetical protein
MRSHRYISRRPPTLPNKHGEGLVSSNRSWTFTTVLGTAIVVLNQALILAFGIFRH